MPASPLEPRSSIAPLAAIFEGGLVIVAIALGWVVHQQPLEQFRWTWEGAAWGLAGTLPLVGGLLVLDRFPVGPLRELKVLVDRSIVPLFAGCTYFELLGISLLAGLGEEMLFRGVVQPAIARLGGSTWIGLAGASVLFGLAHSVSATYAILAGLIGAYLGGLLLASENLLAPIVAHAAYDFAALCYLLRGRRDAQAPPASEL